MNEVSRGIAVQITQLVNALGASATDRAIAALRAWIELIRAWNQRIDLTAARSDDELCDLMIADALVLAPRLGEGARVIDVGTGAGAPGLPLAILRPDLRVTLVEPLQKRVAFLRTVIGSMEWEGARPEVIRGRGEDVVKKGARFDHAISRATLAPERWLSLGAELSSSVAVLLAKEEAPARAGFEIANDERYAWPLTGAERRAVWYRAREG